MNRECKIDSYESLSIIVVMETLVRHDVSFRYNSEDEMIYAHLSEEQADELAKMTLCKVEFIEPSQEELAELEDEVYGIAEVVKDGFFEIEPTTIQFNKYDMYGDEIPYYAEVTGFSIDHFDIELETTDMGTPTIDDIIKPSDKLDILSKIREALKEK